MNDPKARAEAEFRKRQSVLAHIYLGYLAQDKEFLQHLSENPERLQSPHKDSSDYLHNLVMRNYRRGVRRQNVLRMRRPLYVMIFDQRALPASFKRKLEDERRLKRNIIIVQADFLLRRLHEIRMQKDYITFFGLVDLRSTLEM